MILNFPRSLPGSSLARDGGEQAATTSSPVPCRAELDTLAAELSRIAQENALPVAPNLDEEPSTLISTVFSLAEQNTRIHMETGDLSPNELQALDSLNKDLLGLHSLNKNGRLEHPFRVGRDLGRVVRAALVARPAALTVAAVVAPAPAMIHDQCCFRIGYGVLRKPCCLALVKCDWDFVRALSQPIVGGAAGMAPHCPLSAQEAHIMISGVEQDEEQVTL